MRCWIVGLALQCGLLCASPADSGVPSLEKIMSDPDWIGPAVEQPYWRADGSGVYYSLKRKASPLRDLHEIRLKDLQDHIVAPAERAVADGPAVFDPAGLRAAFVRGGDVFVRDLHSGRLTQITRTLAEKSALQFSRDGAKLSFQSGADWWLHDFASGLSMPAAVLKAEKDPEAAPEVDDLRDLQLRTFSTLKRLHDEKQAGIREREVLRAADPTRAPAPFYLGADVIVRHTYLSPDGAWLLVVTSPKAAVKGVEGKLTRYVTESGYEEFETERVRAGRNPGAPQSLVLLDLKTHAVHSLPTDALPGINDDPLKPIREENALTTAAPKTRGVWTVSEEPDSEGGGALWSTDSRQLAIQLLAIDNKDRWLVSVDLRRFSLVLQHRLTDQAWVNWHFNDFGWQRDDRTLWFVSEESGFNQLYAKALDGPVRALTQGRSEVSEPVLSADGRWFYFIGNAEAPFAYDVYRVGSAGGVPERLTHLKGVEHFALERRGHQLLVAYSAPYVVAQLALLNADGSGALRKLTDTLTPEFKAIAWLQPEIVEVPSTHFKGVIYAKAYGRAAAGPDASKPRPAVLFIHGAGYTQDVHLRHPYYFREQMFNNLLVSQGYVVLVMDYRASAGYGRDWRTAIYRQMGHPELEDLLDGKKWMVEQAHADPKRVGLYGGSYGGFMTLMGLFRAPGEFAAGAALRPVTDWMQYDHNYTTAILNDPQIDPLAYQRSSPIEFAAGLQDPLLICHGVIDDNVLFEDSIRLYQRLIELHKDNFTLSPYPLDRHGFTNADSWLDEYKRIQQLFDTHLAHPARPAS